MVLRVTGIGTCKACGREMPMYVSHQKYCSAACHYKGNYLQLEPVAKKARTIGSTLRFGKGRKAFFEKLVGDAVDTHCPYCHIRLNLENMSLDHKEPVLGNDNRLLRALNTPENLHMVCRACNALKGDMSDKEFHELLTFLETRPSLNSKIRRRLGRGDIVWGFKRKSG